MLAFKKPADILQVSIVTDKDTYMPGDLVNFEVHVQSTANLTFNATETPETYASIVVTDDNVYRQLPESQQQPSLPAMVYLEDNIYMVNYEF